MTNLLSFYSGKRVVITGHTGFKGSWLTLWLLKLGAKVIGLSFDEGDPEGIFQKAALHKRVVHEIADVRDLSRITDLFSRYRPEFVFHLAAQPLVRQSFENPVETFHTNVLGTVNVLEAVKQTPSIKAAIMITSDKCYKNKNWVWGYREHDELGGHDPYSASKACAELVIDSYRHSFFREGFPAIASVRAGNVIGGGDWAKDRIVPDCICALQKNVPVSIRNPTAIRPWQHVLEPLSGYLLLGAKLAVDQSFVGSWNFAPPIQSTVPVQELVEKIIHAWGSGHWEHQNSFDGKWEAGMLSLDSSKAKHLLGWMPRLDINQAIALTVEWYKNTSVQEMYSLCSQQIDFYAQNGRKLSPQEENAPIQREE